MAVANADRPAGYRSQEKNQEKIRCDLEFTH
jgi:hypothetical protein